MRKLTRDELNFMDADRVKLLKNVGNLSDIRDLLIINGAHFSGFKAGLDYAQRKLDAYAAYVAGKITLKELEEVVNG